MSKRALLYLLMAASLIVVSACVETRADDVIATDPVEAISGDAAAEESADATLTEPVVDQIARPLGLFDAIEEGLIDVKFIAKDDHKGKLIVENKTNRDVEFRLPEAFVGVPVLAQLGGGGGGGLGGGGGGGQAVGGGGGGLGGGGGGGGGLGGGGGAFSIAPEKVSRIDVPLLCLDHGKRIPSSKKPYKIVPAEEHLASRPDVIELLAAFGRGDLHRDSAQAAVWHANSDVSWQELAAKLDGTARSFVRNPYFSGQEIQTAIAYCQEATRRAAVRVIESEKDAPSGSESMSDEQVIDTAAYEPQAG